MVAAVLSGGPAVLVYGAIVVPIFTMLIALSLAEMASAYPVCCVLTFEEQKLEDCLTGTLRVSVICIINRKFANVE